MSDCNASTGISFVWLFSLFVSFFSTTFPLSGAASFLKNNSFRQLVKFAVLCALGDGCLGTRTAQQTPNGQHCPVRRWRSHRLSLWRDRGERMNGPTVAASMQRLVRRACLHACPILLQCPWLLQIGLIYP